MTRRAARSATVPRRLLRGAHHGLVAGADAARRIWRYAWPAVGLQGNRTYLRDRLIALPLLAVITFCGFCWAFAQVHGDSTYIRDSLAPALEELADARASVQIAQTEARASLTLGHDATLSGLSERYKARSAQATQDLTQVAQHGVLDRSEQLNLNVVIGLLSDYAGAVNRAQGDAQISLRTAELSYAQAMMCSHGRDEAAERHRAASGKAAPVPSSCRNPGVAGPQATTIVDRISTLESDLHGQLAGRAALSRRVLAVGALSCVTFVLLAVGLTWTMVFLNSRFRIMVSLPLLAVAIPLAVLPFMAYDAALAHRAQHRALVLAQDLRSGTSPVFETDAEQNPFSTPSRYTIASLRDETGAALSEDRLLFPGGTGPAVLLAGLAGAAVAAGALHDYGREYRLVAALGAVS